MDRKQFIKACGISCLGLSTATFSLSGCASVYSVQGTVSGKTISFPKDSFFETKKSGEKIARQVIVVNVDNLKFPVAVYDDGNNKYTAVWLKCSHQGNEVSVHGDSLSCSAHGSEYDRSGKVTKGPAKEDLRKFYVRSDETTIFIQLA